MSRLRWPDSTNSVSDDPGTVHSDNPVIVGQTGDLNRVPEGQKPASSAERLLDIPFVFHQEPQ